MFLELPEPPGGSPGASAATSDATVWIAGTNADFPLAKNLGALSTGLVVSTSGVPSVVAHGTNGHVLTMVSGAPAWAAAAGGGLSDGDKGDITVSSSGTVWNIDAGAVGTTEIADDAVNYDKIAHIAGLTVPGNATNSTGPMTSITGVTVGHVLSIVAGPAIAWAAASGGVSDGDKGDITVSSSGSVWTIDNNAVTTAKINDDAVNFAKVGFYLGPFTATAANDFDITLPSGYQGQDINFIDIDIEATAASSAFCDILLNGTDTVDTLQTALNDGSVTPTDAGDGPIVVSTTERTYIHVRIHLRDGGVRIGFARSIAAFGGTWRRYESWFRWADTTTDITSIRLRLDGGVNWTAGSIASAWVG